MTAHVSVRLAWHDDGWNGRVCCNPAANTYCVGNYSYPGQLIAERRILEAEKKCAGEPCPLVKASSDRTNTYIPPCCYSTNAFGPDSMTAYADPPEFFRDGTKRRYWDMPPATTGIWPYEEMYQDDVKRGSGYDNVMRREKANHFFEELQPHRSLIVYYSNYSNPFSEDDRKRYVLVGIARLKAVGDELFYEGCSDSVREKYGSGFVWQRAITSHYPDQGLRIPYHFYRDKPQQLEQMLIVPENPRLCKYAARIMADDDALGLVEQFLSVTQTLREMKDRSENWDDRIRWLQSLVVELWKHRGLYPGLPAVLYSIGFQEAVPFFKAQALADKEKAAVEAIFAFLDGKVGGLTGVNLDKTASQKVIRQWKLQEPECTKLLRDVLPRLHLDQQQVENLLDRQKRFEHGILSSLKAIAENPYILTEEYTGDDPDDTIPWSVVDRGIIPSPNLGGNPLADKDDARRLRGLAVETLKRNGIHMFLAAGQLLQMVNARLDYLPDWKKHRFTMQYFDVDAEVLSGALTTRMECEILYIYLRTAHEDERLVEDKLSFLLNGPDITLKLPVTAKTWTDYLFDRTSILAQKAEKKYREAIRGQAEACQRVFVRPLSVLAGAAGTGKTTIIKAIVKAIKKGHGTGTSVIALTPTGKATDRIREIFEVDELLRGRVETATIHSFLAKRGWLNPNMTLKRRDGTVESGYATYIVDETSMLDLTLGATFVRAVDWTSVQRLILVGDPNQLPPIGRGRLFADIIEHLLKEAPTSIAVLKDNLRLLENQVSDKGTAILELAQLYIHTGQVAIKDEETELAAEIVLRRVQESGEVDKDLRVIFWNNPEDLRSQLIEQIERDLSTDSGSQLNPDRPFELWRKGQEDRADFMQILTPYRGELFGTEAINAACQQRISKRLLERIGSIDGITLFDKVIQVRNRPKSWPIAAFDVGEKHKSKQIKLIEIFNGELGFVKPHGFDGKKWLSNYFRFEHFQVVFARKRNCWVGYGRGLGKGPDNRWLPAESVQENLELAYAISVHKAQGSEFERVYVIIPHSKKALLSPELFYTALTRAKRHCTLLIEKDMAPLLAMRRPEQSHLLRINSSLFAFRSVPEALFALPEWYEEGKIHKTLADIMVRSKSEVIIANMLHERQISFLYEVPLFAKDGSFYLPDFTINWRGTDYYWEHLGLLTRPKYRAKWEEKKKWYETNFPGYLLVTEEGSELSKMADKVIRDTFC